MNSNKTISQLHTILSIESGGSLPEITIAFSSNQLRDMALKYLLSDAVIDSNATLWDDKQQLDRHCSEMTISDICCNLTKSGHLSLSNLRGLEGIGLSAFDLAIVLDFSPGPHWSVKSTGIFLEILRDIKSKGAKSLSLDEDGILYSSKNIDLFREIIS